MLHQKSLNTSTLSYVRGKTEALVNAENERENGQTRKNSRSKRIAFHPRWNKLLFEIFHIGKKNTTPANHF